MAQVPSLPPPATGEHQHQHYERSIDGDGTIREKTITEVVKEVPAPKVQDVNEGDEEGSEAPTEVESGGKKNKRKNKTTVDKEEVVKTIEEVNGVVKETVETTVEDKVIEPTVTAQQTSSHRDLDTASIKAPTVISRVPSVRAPSIAPTARAASIRAPSVRAPSIRAPSVRAPSIRVPSAPSRPATIVAAAPATPTPVAVATVVPSRAPSPTPSHHSHHSHHPEVVVNVTIPQPVAAPPPTLAPQPEPISAAQPALGLVVPDPPQSVQLHTIPLPASRAATVAPSPTPSRRTMHLPKFLQSSPKEAVIEEEQVVNPNEQVTMKTVTTTTTTRQPVNPPAEIVAAPLAVGYVENDPNWRPPPPPVAPLTPISPARDTSPKRVIETTTVETVTYPITPPKHSALPAPTEDAPTYATVRGGPTTRGIGGQRDTALSESDGRRSGTKGGLRPISYVDYSALIRQTPTTRRLKLPHTVTPEAPKTVLTMSADLERDNKGNEHLHATVRDHTGALRTEMVDETEPVTLINENKPVGEDGKKSKKDKKKKKDGDEDRYKGPLYRRLGGDVPPPRSERYAYPPAPTAIANAARERYMNRFQGPGPDPAQVGRNGPRYNSFPPPGPAMFPRPPPMMASRPPMYGAPMLNPMMMGMPGGMGMMGMPMPGMGIPAPGMDPMGMRGMLGNSAFGAGMMGPGYYGRGF
ncbi:hypothetical protein BCR39DRAFT_539834 [Naematelia encephala]|uniref:Uncharacterized protein n=1 Tax=Naematelia encephala TaxID=71784 RepID=A0A1Y2AW92_9TREE|nr:hypothetical protein BCR39DRAFT_539834 [Naematelia encephala]